MGISLREKNTKHLTKWVSATFGILTPRSTAKALALAERAATVTVSSVSTASTCAVSASISTPRTSGSKRWTEEGEEGKNRRKEASTTSGNVPARLPTMREATSPEVSMSSIEDWTT